MFAELENKYIPNCDKLLHHIDYNYNNNLDIPLEEIKRMMLFYIITFLRSGALMEEYSIYSDNRKKERVERLLSNLLYTKYPIELSETIINGYTISIVVNPDSNFVLSDQFISTVSLRFKNNFSNISNRQIGLKDTMLMIPVSPKYYILFYHGDKPRYIKGNRYSLLNRKQIDELNKVIILNSYNKSISLTEEPLIKFKNKTQEYVSSPERMIMVYSDNTISIATKKKEIEFYDTEEYLSKNFTEIYGKYLQNYKGKVNRNDICLCDSGKKYKNCCLNSHNRVISLGITFKNRKKPQNYQINDAKCIEKPIEVFRGSIDKIPKELSTDRNLLKELNLRMRKHN